MLTSQSSRSNRPPRHLFVIIAGILSVGILLSAWVYVHSRQTEKLRVESEFARRTDVRNALSRETISFYESGVYALKSLFEGSSTVSPTEFRRVANDILGRYPGITALEWVPMVADADREQFEKRASSELGDSFRFTQPDADGNMVPASPRAEHYPILYVEPLIGNERARGYDLQAAPTRAFLERARESGKMVVSGQFPLVQSRMGIVLIWPVTDPGLDGSSQFRGFVQGVFRLEEMLRTPELRNPPTSTEMLYVDDTPGSKYDRILYYDGSPGSDESVSPELETAFRSGLHREYVLDFGGRKWSILYRPTSAWVAEQSSRIAGVRVSVGLLITALVACLVTVMARRTFAVQREVAERTAELSESRRHLSSLLHALPGMAYRCIYDDKLRVVYLSEGVLSLTGYRADEFTAHQMHFRDIVHPGDLDRVRTATRKSLETRQEVEVEYRIRPRCGPERWVLSRGKGVYNDQGELLFFEGLAIDITARKEAEADKLAMERKLLESQKLESLGLLAGGIAHDFNNLLTGIMGHANLARFHPGIDAEVTDHLRKIEAGSVRAAELCQQMLAYSGRGNFLIEPVDLNQLVRETLPLLQGSLSPRARVSLELGSQSIVVMADATQLRQIAMNLILNAADSLGATGGTINVTTGRRPFGRDFLAAAHAADALAVGEYVFLEVRDTGCGMSAETMAKIFDPFFTTKFTGRGLGLAAVLGIVRGHSGALRVESEINRGSTFTLILPPSQEGLSRNGDLLSSTPWHRKGTVLVIDDEESVRNVACALLRSFGFTPVSAANGSDGIECFRSRPKSFEVVLLDLTMPRLDGEETLAGLRAIDPAVRVVLVSGYSENDRIGEMAAGGPLLFLQKPFTRGSLQQRLQQIFVQGSGKHGRRSD